MRIEGWEKRMMDYLDHVARQPFEYGRLDCVVFACDHVENVTGIDPLDGGGRGADGRGGNWDNVRDGVKLIKKYRGSTEGIMDFYFNRRAPASAQRGDVVIKIVEGLKAFGVVGTAGRAYFKKQGLGLVSFPAAECDLAWRVE